MALLSAPGPRTSAPLPDAAVIERSWSEPERFATLFDRHADVIHRYATLRVGRDTADDLLAETFALAFEQRRRYDLGYLDARPWLFGIATNLIRRHRRAEARRLRALAREPRMPEQEPLADRAEARMSAGERTSDLAAGLARLPSRQRDIVLLYAWAELEYVEIAHALGVPVGTVRSRLHRGREHLRKTLANGRTGP